MHTLFGNKFLATGAFLGLFLAFNTVARADSTPELKFDVLQIGTETLSNVTVTTTNSEYVFLLHSKGMGNYKVAKLPPDVLKQLGYAVPDESRGTNSVVSWAKENVKQMDAENVQQIEEALLTKLPPKIPELIQANLPTVAGVVAGLLFLHIFVSYCFLVICHKTGTEPGFLVWIPILQLIPLTKAAGMSPVWAIIFVLPFISLIAQVVWSFKICKARGFGAGLALLLLIPPVNVFAFLYLTFAAGSTVRKNSEPKARGTELMTLETA